MPVCHQGFFVPHENLPEWMIGATTKYHWLEYQPVTSLVGATKRAALTALRQTDIILPRLLILE
jgi:hypothetical protein